MQVQPFHLILFWPLRINVRPANDTGQAKHFWDFITERMRLDGQDWELVQDPLFRGGSGDRTMEYQEAVYFHPFVQKVIYAKPDDGANPLRLYRRKGLQTMEVALDEKRAVSLKVERMHLYVFDTQLAILVTEVSHAGPLELTVALDLQNTLRRIYPPGWSGMLQDKSRPDPVDRPLHTPHAVSWVPAPSAQAVSRYTDKEFFQDWLQESRQPAASPHWTELLPSMQPFEGRDKNAGKGYHLLGDDRMGAMAFFGLEDPRSLHRSDLIRMGFADGSGDWPLPYAPEFLADFEKLHCYDRFWTATEPDKHWMFNTRYLISGWSFSVMGAGGADSFFAAQIRPHFQHHYFQMGLLVYLQYSSLLVFSDQLSAAVQYARSDQAEYRRRIERVATDFAIFTDRYWLTDVTNQVQGQDLYNLWVTRLRLRELYSQVRDEVHYVNEILEAQAQGRLTEQANKLSRAGFPYLVGSLLCGFWGSNFLDKTDGRLYVSVTLIVVLASWLIWALYLGKKQQP